MIQFIIGDAIIGTLVNYQMTLHLRFIQGDIPYHG